MKRTVGLIAIVIVLSSAYYLSALREKPQNWSEEDLYLWRAKIERLALNPDYGIGAVWLGKDSLARDNYIHIAISPYGDKEALINAIKEEGIPSEAVKIEVWGEYDEDFTKPEPTCPIEYTNTRGRELEKDVTIYTSFGTSGMYYLKLLACEEDGSNLKLTFKLWKCNPASVMCTDDLVFPAFGIRFLKDYQNVRVTILADSWKGKGIGIYTFNLTYKPLWILYEDGEERKEMYIYRDGWIRVLYSPPSKEALEAFGSPYIQLYPWELFDKYGHNLTKLNQEILAIAKKNGYRTEEKNKLIFVYVPDFSKEVLGKVKSEFGEYVQAIVLKKSE
ncbi:hypothetical protein EP1X_04170 [Thermococcus sp. EP1]|uniref:hypothetical protein n=1 Tax=Thermococcus sp. EP1 TaxID=1591054 RepID=UPI0006DA9CBC|nr:hypothetical protein [Thermococcus sp. EP1]KPU63535.1 hypothetical protein EP1X_04170 [Thermococcus sp. EP1]